MGNIENFFLELNFLMTIQSFVAKKLCYLSSVSMHYPKQNHWIVIFCKVGNGLTLNIVFDEPKTSTKWMHTINKIKKQKLDNPNS